MVFQIGHDRFKDKAWLSQTGDGRNILGSDIMKKRGYIIDYGNSCIWRNSQTSGDVVQISDVHAVHAIKKTEDYDLDALLSVENSELADLLTQHMGVFAQSKHDCGRVDPRVMEVTVEGRDPPSLRQYNYPEEASPYIQRTVDSLLEQGVIRPCLSPSLSPIWPVRKPDGSWRLCIDYRELNKCTPACAPVVASTPDVLASLLPEAHFYSALDVSNGFWSIPLHPECQYKFAFKFKNTQYTWNVLPQGFANSPTLFHQCLATIVEPFSRPECLIVYVDDLLLQTSTQEEHLILLSELLQLLEGAGLKLNPKKAQLLKSEVTYLGIKVSKGGRTPDPHKVETIQRLPVPVSVTALRSFLGIVGFCRDFIEGFADIAKPLNSLLTGKKRKNYSLDWGPEHQTAFEKLKASLMAAPALRNPDRSQPFILQTAATEEALSAVLLQEVQGSLRPIAYASRVLSPVEKAFDSCTRHLLAVHWAMSHFEYIYGFNEVTLHTPHTPLTLLLNGKVKGVSNTRLARWTLHLGAKNLKTEYRPNSMLPRTLIYEGVPHTCEHEPTPPHDSVFEVRPIEGAMDIYVDGSRYWQDGQYHTGFAIHSEIGDFLYKCPPHFSAQKAEITAVLQTLQVLQDRDLNIHSDSAFVVNSLTEYLPIWQKRGFTSADGQPLIHCGPIQSLWSAAKSSQHKLALLKVKAHQKKGTCKHGDGNLIVDELAKTAAVEGMTLPVDEGIKPVAVINVREPVDLKSAQQSDPLLKEVIMLKQQGKTISEGPFAHYDAHLTTHDNILLYTANDNTVWVPPVGLRNDILYYIHNQGGHLGVAKVKDRLRSMFWWPDVDKHIQDHCMNCLTCAQMNPSSVKRKGCLRPTCLAEGPWTNLQIDYVGPLPAAKGGYRYILVVIDTFSKWIETFPIKSDTASATARVLWEHIYCRWGLPLSLESDRGTHFTGKIHTDLTKLLGIKHRLHIAHHPQSSGSVERTNRTLKTALKKMVLENGPNWAQNLPSILMSVRGIVHKSTGYSPHELMTGRKMRMPEHLLLEVPKPMVEGWTAETFFKNLCSSLPTMYHQAAQQIGSNQKYNKMYYDKTVNEQTFELGTEVMVKNYHHTGPWTANWSGPYTVID